MKRIGGILNLDGAPVGPRDLQSMAAVLGDGDPRHVCVWTDRNVGLATVTLDPWITENGSGQESPGSRGNSVLVLDGRIDNREHLFSVLGMENGRGVCVPDTEVVLSAYEKWDSDFPAHLIGDFGLALWDRKARALICVRDHLGVKPLYYHVSRQCFVFASSPQAVLACPRVPGELDSARIADVLLEPAFGLECLDKTSTFFAGILRLEPAHILTVSEKGIQVRRYWHPDASREPAARTPEQYVDEFRELLDQAVRCRISAELPSTMLSGGLDSSAIAGTARQLLAAEGRGPLHTFSVISNGPDVGKDTVHIRAVLGQGGLQAHLFSETELVQRMDDLVSAFEAGSDPFDCLMTLPRALYLDAKEAGVSALLDGIDGNILLLSPHAVCRLLSRKGAHASAIREALSVDGMTTRLIDSAALLFATLRWVFAPDWMRSLRRSIRYRTAVASAVKTTIINPELAARSQLGDRLARLESHAILSGKYSQVEAHIRSLTHPALTLGLERYERVAAAFGIEARHPLIDVRLVEFCLGVPWQLQTRKGWTKLVLRRAVEPILPWQVVWRRDKESLGWHFNKQLLRARHAHLFRITLESRDFLEPYVNMPRLLEFWHDFQEKGDEGSAQWLFYGAALAVWLRRQQKIHV